MVMLVKSALLDLYYKESGAVCGDGVVSIALPTAGILHVTYTRKLKIWKYKKMAAKKKLIFKK